jgi:sugar phosphate isomerase/epimerase
MGFAVKYVLFTDNLADLTIEQTCRRVKAAGFDGLDLTLRPGGHVLPQDAEMGLSRATQIAEREGISISMASTAISDTSSPHAETIFASCAHYGIRKIKLGYWRYQPFGKLVQQLKAAELKLKRLAALGRKYGVLPCVHVHSGDVLANGGPVLYLILKDFDPAEVGAYVDPMHMTVEGGSSGWEMGLDLLAPWVALLGMKNFRWVENGRDDFGQLRFRPQYTPLADGQAPLPQFMARLKQLNYDGLVSLHSEYKGQSSFRKLDTTELLTQSEVDLKYLKSIVSRG